MTDPRTTLAGIGSVVIVLLTFAALLDGILRSGGGPGLFSLEMM